jgi:hypothetical protein
MYGKIDRSDSQKRQIMRNFLIFTAVILSTSILFGCAKKHRLELTESVTTETTTPKTHRVQTIRRIPRGQLIRITDLEKVEVDGDRPIMGAMTSPLPAVGRRALHNIGIGKTLTASDIWWEPRSAYAQSDLVQNDVNLAKARWHEKEDLKAEEEFRNSSITGGAPSAEASASKTESSDSGTESPKEKAAQ